jgi:Zn-finger protein
MDNSYRFFQNKACEYFPCHKGGDVENFNCLFCYCPLYALGENCGGNWTCTENGIKDCSHCLLPHTPGGYDYITAKFSQISELARVSPREKQT